MQRRERTHRLIELGGLVQKSGLATSPATTVRRSTAHCCPSLSCWGAIAATRRLRCGGGAASAPSPPNRTRRRHFGPATRPAREVPLPPLLPRPLRADGLRAGADRRRDCRLGRRRGHGRRGPVAPDRHHDLRHPRRLDGLPEVAGRLCRRLRVVDGAWLGGVRQRRARPQHAHGRAGADRRAREPPRRPAPAPPRARPPADDRADAVRQGRRRDHPEPAGVRPLGPLPRPEGREHLGHPRPPPAAGPAARARPVRRHRARRSRASSAATISPPRLRTRCSV